MAPRQLSSKMAEMGDHHRVREMRMAFQVATAEEFVAVVEQIVHRKVRAFSSATDVTSNVIFENFVFEASDASGVGNGSPGGARPRAGRRRRDRCPTVSIG
jgi:hypothetical protein